MFLTDTKTILGKNDLLLSEISEIFDELSNSKLVKDVNNLQTMAVESIHGKKALLLINGNTIKIIRINNMLCNVTIQKEGKSFRAINKDLDLQFGYVVEDIGNSIEKISSMVKHDNNVVSQSYVKKNNDAITIIHNEFIDSSNIIGNQNKALELFILNEPFAKASNEELIDLSMEYDLGGENSLNEEDDDEIEFDDDYEEEYNENIEEEKEALRAYLEDFEIEELSDLDAYEGYIVKENGIDVDAKSAKEMIDDVTADLLSETMYYDEEMIHSLNILFEQINTLIEKKINEKDLTDLTR